MQNKVLLQLLILLLIQFSLIEATPTGLFWTSCTTDVIDTGMGNIDINNYFTLFNRRGHGSVFPSLTAFEVGLMQVGAVKIEGGVDYLGGNDDPLFFNLGGGITEDVLFKNAPSMKVGLFGMGTRTHGSNRTNQNIFDIIIGKGLPDCIGGRFFIGGFSGSKAMGKDRQGVMLGYQRSFNAAKDSDGIDYYKWIFSLDYASGKNTIGGGGFSVTYCFTPLINIQTGPVWFNSRAINGRWKWTMQINVNFSVFDTKKVEGLY